MPFYLAQLLLAGDGRLTDRAPDDVGAPGQFLRSKVTAQRRGTASTENTARAHWLSVTSCNLVEQRFEPMMPDLVGG